MAIVKDMMRVRCNAIDKEIVDTMADFIIWLQMVIAAMKLKDAYSLEGKLWPT